MSRVPQRFQQRRAPGWRKPPGAVCVSRPSRFANPFTVATHGRSHALELFARWLDGEDSVVGTPERRRRLLDGLTELRGRDLGCYCRTDEACHADILLDLANRTGHR